MILNLRPRPGVRLRAVERRGLVEARILRTARGRRRPIELRDIERMAGIRRVETRRNVEARNAGGLHVGLRLVAVVAADEVMHRLAAAEREQRGSGNGQQPGTLPLTKAVLRISGCQNQPPHLRSSTRARPLAAGPRAPPAGRPWKARSAAAECRPRSCPPGPGPI